MVVLVGTPRSGTSYLYYWYTNKYPELLHHQHDHSGEYFHPWYMEGDETLERLTHLTEQSIIKVHTGRRMNSTLWDFLNDKEVITIARKNKLEQFCSWGVACHTNTWINKVSDSNLKIEYKEEWFKDLEQFLLQFRDMYGNKPDIWYEDMIEKYPPQKNMYLPIKQNFKYIENFINQDEILSWYEEYTKK